jgi:hypothetical protein
MIEFVNFVDPSVRTLLGGAPSRAADPSGWGWDTQAEIQALVPLLGGRADSFYGTAAYQGF